MSSEQTNNYLHEIRMDVPDDPPDYNEVVKMGHIPTAPLLEGRADDTLKPMIFTSSRNSTTIMSSERASPLPNDPPNYNYAMIMSRIPTAPLSEGRENGTPCTSVFGVGAIPTTPLLEGRENGTPSTSFGVATIPTAPSLEGRQDRVPFISIFGMGTCFQFEAAASGCSSFYIRDSDGSLQAKGNTNSGLIVVHNFDGMEMLKLIELSAEIDGDNGSTIRTFGVVYKDVGLGTIKVGENSLPRPSLQIIRGNCTPFLVKSLRIGDFVVFRNQSSITPLCNIGIPDVFSSDNFNIKIIFHPHSGITKEEQLLCTSSAIAFKSTMKRNVDRHLPAIGVGGVGGDSFVMTTKGSIMFIGICFLIFAAVILIVAKWEQSTCKTRRPPYNKRCEEFYAGF